MKVRKKLMRAYHEESAKNYLVRVHPSVACIIEENHTQEAPLLPVCAGKAAYVLADEKMHVSTYEVSAVGSEEELSRIRHDCRQY